jgi:hypothetical protein
VDEDAPGMVLAAALAQNHCTACLVYGSWREEEACNAWLHHACLRTKGRMVLITSMRSPVYEHLAVVALQQQHHHQPLRVRTYKCVLDTHSAIIHLYLVIRLRVGIGLELPYLHTYLEARVFCEYDLLPCCRSMRETFAIWNCQARNGVCPRSTVTMFQSSDPGEEQRGLDQI